MGAGPAGAVLALLLVRKSVPVTLLEAHRDFDREFRGDTIHPSVMEVLDDLGLADRLLELPHTKLRRATLQTAGGPFTPVDFSRLDTRFPYITLMPQTAFLEFITGEAARHPGFGLVMGANVKELVRKDGAVCGVRYPRSDGTHEVRAPLTVGADGRFSKLRRLAGLEAVRTSPPMDVLWFRLPRRPDEPEGATGRVAPGALLALLDRRDHWQAGYVIPKGSYHVLREEGLDALRRRIGAIAPELADRTGALREWSDISLLQVESDRLRRWYLPGLLLIGDAAHVMSPVGGVGINYAIHDAVAAANLLAEPLAQGRVETKHLARVQRRRELPTRVIQAIQSAAQRRFLAAVLSADQPIRIPRWLRLLARVPVLRDVPARVMGFGLRPERFRA